MSELEDYSGMSERDALNAMTVTLLQIRDWVAVIARTQNPEVAKQVDATHRQHRLVLDLPEYDQEA